MTEKQDDDKHMHAYANVCVTYMPMPIKQGRLLPNAGSAGLFLRCASAHCPQAPSPPGDCQSSLIGRATISMSFQHRPFLKFWGSCDVEHHKVRAAQYEVGTS